MDARIDGSEAKSLEATGRRGRGGDARWKRPDGMPERPGAREMPGHRRLRHSHHRSRLDVEQVTRLASARVTAYLVKARYAVPTTFKSERRPEKKTLLDIRSKTGDVKILANSMSRVLGSSPSRFYGSRWPNSRLQGPRDPAEHRGPRTEREATTSRRSTRSSIVINTNSTSRRGRHRHRQPHQAARRRRRAARDRDRRHLQDDAAAHDEAARSPSSFEPAPDVTTATKRELKGARHGRARLVSTSSARAAARGHRPSARPDVALGENVVDGSRRRRGPLDRSTREALRPASTRAPTAPTTRPSRRPSSDAHF